MSAMTCEWSPNYIWKKVQPSLEPICFKLSNSDRCLITSCSVGNGYSMAVEFKSGTMRWMLHVTSILAFPFRNISKNNSAESNMVLSHKFQSLYFNFLIIRYPFKFFVAEKPKSIVQVDANGKRWKRILQLLRKGGVDWVKGECIV